MFTAPCTGNCWQLKVICIYRLFFFACLMTSRQLILCLFQGGEILLSVDVELTLSWPAVSPSVTTPLTAHTYNTCSLLVYPFYGIVRPWNFNYGLPGTLLPAPTTTASTAKNKSPNNYTKGHCCPSSADPLNLHLWLPGMCKASGYDVSWYFHHIHAGQDASITGPQRDK